MAIIENDSFDASLPITAAISCIMSRTKSKIIPSKLHYFYYNCKLIHTPKSTSEIPIM